jgi:predicted nucleic acid-binding protein
MNIISDTNIFLAVVLNEPEKDRIIQLTSNMDVIAPEILPYEIGNALSAMIKRKQISHDKALSAHQLAGRIPAKLVSIDIHQALQLAIEFNIYAYDAYFLQCARSMSHPMLTLDKRMKQIATKLNIEVLELTT